MIPNNYGLIRQPGADLIALRFPVFETGNYSIEEIQLTKHENMYFPGNGTMSENSDYNAYTANVSKYDEIIFGISSGGGGIYSGVQAAEGSGSLTAHCLYVKNDATPGDCVAYMKIKVDPVRPWLAITEKKDHPVFAFGIINKED